MFRRGARGAEYGPGGSGGLPCALRMVEERLELARAAERLLGWRSALVSLDERERSAGQPARLPLAGAVGRMLVGPALYVAQFLSHLLVCHA